MNHAHHSHLFSHERFVLRPDLLGKLKRYGPALGLGALLASAVLLISTIYSALDMPLMDAEAMTAATEELFVPTGLTSYLPPQF